MAHITAQMEIDNASDLNNQDTDELTDNEKEERRYAHQRIRQLLIRDPYFEIAQQSLADIQLPSHLASLVLDYIFNVIVLPLDPDMHRGSIPLLERNQCVDSWNVEYCYDYILIDSRWQFAYCPLNTHAYLHYPWSNEFCEAPCIALAGIWKLLEFNWRSTVRCNMYTTHLMDVILLLDRSLILLNTALVTYFNKRLRRERIPLHIKFVQQIRDFVHRNRNTLLYANPGRLSHRVQDAVKNGISYTQLKYVTQSKERPHVKSQVFRIITQLDECLIQECPDVNDATITAREDAIRWLANNWTVVACHCSDTANPPDTCPHTSTEPSM